MPWTAACQASLFFTISWSLFKLMSIELVMPSNLPILCFLLLLLPSIFPSISVFSNESALHKEWPKYWRFSFSISHSNECLGLILYFTVLLHIFSSLLKFSLSSYIALLTSLGIFMTTILTSLSHKLFISTP